VRVELHRLTRFLGLVTTIALGGCQAAGGGALQDAYYLGLVRVRAADGADTSRHVRTLGVWVDSGVGAGWRESRRVTVSRDCQVVFLVTSPAEFEKARAWVQAEEAARGKLCVALDDGSR
jgi:hypothetical protein